MSLAFRAFFALPVDIQTSSGLVTNALHGFASMLVSLVGTQRPRALAVAFDLPGGTFRDVLTEDYKGGRDESPPEIEHQFDLIRTMCEILHIPVLGVEQFEADDVLATLATWGREAQIPVIIVSGDRDTFQLVEDPFVKVLYNRRGVSDYSLYDEAGIMERCGIEAPRYPLLAALRGDTSDNLPGVPGIVEKTAAKLFAQYRDFDDLYAHLDTLTPKLRENLAAFEERARNNERVMRLVRDVPLDFTLDDITLGGWNREEVNGFFERYEMNSMRTRIGKLMQDGLLGEGVGDVKKPVEAKPRAVSAAAKVGASLEAIFSGPVAPLVAFNDDRVAAFNSSSLALGVFDVEEFVRSAGDRSFAGHDVKGLYRVADQIGITLSDPADDTSIMAFLIDSISGRYELADVASRFLGEVNEDARPSLFSESSDDTLIHDVQQIGRLRDVLRSEIERWELQQIYEEVELPLVAVLGRMEGRGIRVDVALLRTIAEEFSTEARELEVEIQKVAGHDFKVNSPQQLQTVLFDELGLTAVK
jgi:DNA polymerase-1